MDKSEEKNVKWEGNKSIYKVFFPYKDISQKDGHALLMAYFLPVLPPPLDKETENAYLLSTYMFTSWLITG